MTRPARPREPVGECGQGAVHLHRRAVHLDSPHAGEELRGQPIRFHHPEERPLGIRGGRDDSRLQGSTVGQEDPRGPPLPGEDALHGGIQEDLHAPGLRALVEALRGLGTITVVAPSQERSAAAQSLTLRQPIYCDQIAEREYSVEGTPADAMILAFHTLLKEKPDIVVSGINRGGNVGENIY